MTDLSLEGLLLANPLAAKQGDEIRDTLRLLDEIRSAGRGTQAVGLAPPYGGKLVAVKHRREVMPYPSRLLAD